MMGNVPVAFNSTLTHKNGNLAALRRAAQMPETASAVSLCANIVDSWFRWFRGVRGSGQGA
jgi:hypothetical protein